MSLRSLDSVSVGRGCRCTAMRANDTTVKWGLGDNSRGHAYLCHNHEKRLEQQREFEAVPQPEEATSNVREQSVTAFREISESNQHTHRIAHTSREKPIASLRRKNPGMSTAGRVGCRARTSSVRWSTPGQRKPMEALVPYQSMQWWIAMTVS